MLLHASQEVGQAAEARAFHSLLLNLFHCDAESLWQQVDRGMV